MTRVFIWRAARLLSASLVFVTALTWAAPQASAQEPAQQPSESSTPATPQPEAAPADEPLTIITMQRKN